MAEKVEGCLRGCASCAPHAIIGCGGPIAVVAPPIEMATAMFGQFVANQIRPDIFIEPQVNLGPLLSILVGLELAHLYGLYIVSQIAPKVALYIIDKQTIFHK